MIIGSEKKQVVCDPCLDAMFDSAEGSAEVNNWDLAQMASEFGDALENHLCSGREGDVAFLDPSCILLDTETCICRCNLVYRFSAWQRDDCKVSKRRNQP